MTAKIRVCEACGHPVPPDGVRAVLGKRQRRFFDLVTAAGQAGITAINLRDRLYADDFEGGPESDSIIQVMAAHIRKKLQPFGLTVKGTRGHGSVYRLLPLERK